MPRPVHFEIQAENTDRAIKFYTMLFALEVLAVGPGEVLADHDRREGHAGHRRRPAAASRAGRPRRDGRGQRLRVHGRRRRPRRDARARSGELGGRIVVPRMPIPTVGYLAYAKDTEGNVFGMMQMDAGAR